MYVSRNVKEILRPYAGRAMEIDANDVWQPMNPGDGLIRKLTVVGEAKALAQTLLASVAGIGSQASVLVQGKRALANIEIENTNARPASISVRDVGFAIFSDAQRPEFPLIPSDSPSFALITRVDVGVADGAGGIGNMHWEWRTTKFPDSAPIGPKDRTAASILMELPRGRYQFLAGYAGGVHAGLCVASNAVSFDIG